jgi:carbonic anhydrase
MSVTAADALARLKEGNARFQEDKVKGEQRDGARRAGLTGGQEPYAAILTCADSRVVPELAFDAGLGELFVVRVAGNVANTTSIASLEYAIAHLDTKLIVVMGHESCGGVGAAVEDTAQGPNLQHLVAMITPVVQSSDDRSVNAVARLNAVHVARALVNDSEILRKAVDNNGVMVVPAYYNLGSGAVDFVGGGAA